LTETNSLYELLFGMAHLVEGNVIDMAEHGRTGGTPSGEPFKVVGIVPAQVKIQEKTSGVDSYTFIGESRAGAAESDLEWRLTRVSEFASNASLSTVIEFVNGDSNYLSAWTSRASLSYS
jgi:hypothetical protein